MLTFANDPKHLSANDINNTVHLLDCLILSTNEINVQISFWSVKDNVKEAISE